MKYNTIKSYFLATAITALLPLGANAQSSNVGALYYADGDFAAAYRQWLPLAEKGDASLQNSIGRMHDTGRGVLKDKTEAAKWYRLAAEQGHSTAQYNLGTLYADGNSVLKDYVLAHQWYNISGANGTEFGRENRDSLEKKMTPEQIAEATKLAKICMESDYQDCG